MTASITWPASRFYWAVVDAPLTARTGSRGGTRPLPAGMLLVLQDELPAPLEELLVVGLPLADGRTLACAARREDLTALPHEALALAPESLPRGVDAPCDPAAINLLIGEFEPRPIRRARTRRHAMAMAAVLVASMMVCVGLSRRAAHATNRAEAAEARARELLAAAGTGSGDPGAELARIRGSRAALAAVQPTPEAAPALLAVLRAWPAKAAASVQSLSITGGIATLSLSVEGDPAPLLTAMTPPAGWTIDEPRINASGSAAGAGAAVTRVVLTFRPTDAAVHAAAAGKEDVP